MTPDDEAPAIETVVLAFVADPVTRWVWPRADQYLSAMPRFVRAFGGNAFARGGAYCSGEYSGAALWLPPDVHPDGDRLDEIMESTASPAAREAGSALFEQMATYHPKEPHWYLPLIGVDPAQQGKGHGDALMRYALERFDRDEVPAYLESTNPRNISLYLRHGFEALGTIQAGSSPTLVPMVRRRHRALAEHRSNVSAAQCGSTPMSAISAMQTCSNPSSWLPSKRSGQCKRGRGRDPRLERAIPKLATIDR
jgi:ribosomal protein S18 acetylase RimI-like enzyme